jgi:formylglycine-generating enzyme required for sulfatase activity
VGIRGERTEKEGSIRGELESRSPDEATFNRSWDEGPEAITAKPKGRGPFGTLNQAGNVWEWVTDCWRQPSTKAKAQSDKTTRHSR